MAKPIFPYQQVRRFILEQFDQGIWKPGDLLPAEVKLAAQLSVHRLTVNRVMTELVREGVLVRKRGVGTIVEQRKRGQGNPVLGKGLVGLITGHHFNPATNPYYGFIFEKMRRMLSEQGIYLMPLGDATEFFEKPSKTGMAGNLRESLSAIALLGTGGEGIFQLLENFERPAVIIGVSEYDGPLPSVSTDDEADAARVAEKILSLGHRNIVHVNAASPLRMHARLQGFLSACERAGCAIPFRHVVEARGLEISDGLDAMREFLDRKLEFTAVFGGNDNLALGALAALKERGISVPENVSVVGFDGIEAGIHSQPLLTTMKISRQRLAEQAVARLVTACTGVAGSNLVDRLDSQWIEGGSLAACPA
ncbi:MAG: GntR family transcriptional regulator [Verrucomicrobiota bacterium]